MSETSWDIDSLVSLEVDDNLTFKDSLRLVLRTWPYIKKQLIHILTFLGLNLIASVIYFSIAFVANDLMNNKILLGERLQPLQANILFLDDRYITTGIENESKLTVNQRRAVRDQMLWVFSLAALLFLGIAVITPYYSVWIYQRINQDLRVRMLERIEHLSLKYHSHARSGDLIYRIYQDSATITNVIQTLIVIPAQSLSVFVFTVLILSFFSPWLGLLCLATAIPVIWLLVWFTPRIQERSRLARSSNSNLTSRIQEVFSMINIVKANRAESTVLQRFNADSRQALDMAFLLRVEIMILHLATAMLMLGAVLVMEYLMANWTIGEKTTYLGGVIAMVGFAIWNLGAYQSAIGRTNDMTLQAGGFIRNWGAAQDLLIGLDRAFYLLDLEPEITDTDSPKAFPLQVDSVSWREVSFSYDTSQPVLKHLSLTAKKGTVTAIVGATGSGKSTLMSMLLRLYDPNDGDIYINDTNVKEIAIRELRTNVTIALQQNVLFAATVAENIAFALDVSNDAIRSAAKVACADEFIEEMKLGYETELGERGGKLSTGQRQRLSIARAIIRDTPILILDEPTSSLDAATEQRLLQNLNSWGKDRIVFIITHRLSTIRNADQIALLKNGEIVEAGDHESLMSKHDGEYRRFVEDETIGTSHE